MLLLPSLTTGTGMEGERERGGVGTREQRGEKETWNIGGLPEKNPDRCLAEKTTGERWG